MHDNKLKVNEAKTEFLVVGSKSNRMKADVTQLRVGQSTVDTSETVRNLGVNIDETLSLEQQIKDVVKSRRFHLHALWQIRPYLSQYNAKLLVHASIISRLDYCNSLYVNMPPKQINKLQKVIKGLYQILVNPL